jgi:hypothetical protein
MASLIRITPPKAISAQRMLVAANNLENSQHTKLFDNLVLPMVPPRSVNDILTLIQSGNDKYISLLEWITLFEQQDLLSDLKTNQSTRCKNLIWECLIQNSNIRHIAFWRMCLYFDGNTEMMPYKLLGNHKNDLASLVSIDKQKTLVVIAISDNNKEDLAYFALQSSLKPEHLLFKLGLPFKIGIAKESLLSLEKVLAKQGIAKFEQCYLNILTSYSDLETDAAVSRVINSVNNDDIEDSELLLDYIRQNYAPTSVNTRWKYLNRDTQNKLRELLGTAWFGDFKKFVFQITSQKVAAALNLTEGDINQLQKRVTFWSNYQSRLHSFKIFLPLKTSLIIKNLGIEVQEHSAVIGFESSRFETELCVLEFDNHIVVEYLRGGSSDVKFFNKSNFQAESLLSSSSLSISYINGMNAVEEHDHVAFWQNSCERLLRTKLNITPDNSLKRFKIQEATSDKKSYEQSYSRATGLPKLTLDKQKIRDEQLRQRNLEINPEAVNFTEKLMRVSNPANSPDAKVSKSTYHIANPALREVLQRRENLEPNKSLTISVGDQFVAPFNRKLKVVEQLSEDKWLVDDGTSQRPHSTKLLKTFSKLN